MTDIGVLALTKISNQLIETVHGAVPDKWNHPSACPGWTNHDVLLHIVCTLREVVSPDTLPPPVPGSIERTNDAAVAHFRGEPVTRTLANYLRFIGPVIEAVSQQQIGVQATLTVDFDDAGTYPMHLIVDSLVFDHYCHLHNDLAAPRGTLTRGTDGNVDETVIRSSLSWLIAGLPQMSPGRLSSALTGSVALVLEGSGGGVWTMMPPRFGDRVSIVAGNHDADATITTSAEAFHLWATHRTSPFEHDVRVKGNDSLATRVLEAIHVF